MKKSATKFLKKKTNVLFTYSQAGRPQNAFMDTGGDPTTTVVGTGTATTHIFDF